MNEETPGTALEQIRVKLAEESKGIKDRILAPSGDSIRILKTKKFKLPDGTVSDGPLSVVILDFVAMNQLYDRPWVEGEAQTPVCMAFGNDPKQLVPYDTSPEKQSEVCKGCWANEWKSHANGKGKACANTRLLAVVANDTDANSPMLLLKVSKTGVKHFDAYVQSISDEFGSVPVSVVTDIFFDANEEFPTLRFGNPTPNDNLATHYNRRKAAMARLTTEPDFSAYLSPTKPKGKKA